jgi:hypothetical protein
MKPVRVTTLLLAVASLAAAPAAHGATSATGNASVTANVANSLEATFPGNYAFGGLAPGNNLGTEQVTTVKSNAAWGLKVATDLANGRMAEWTGSAYVSAGKSLATPLEWSVSSIAGAAQPASWNAFSSTGAGVVSSQPATDDSGRTVGVTYRQTVSYADQSASPNSYRIQVAYTAQQGF